MSWIYTFCLGCASAFVGIRLLYTFCRPSQLNRQDLPLCKRKVHFQHKWQGVVAFF